MANISREWKQEVSIENYQTFSLKVNLFDLLFYTKDGYIYPRVSYTNNKITPVELQHKIAVFNENNYEYDKFFVLRTTDNENIIKEQTRSKYALAIPQFDLRSLPLFLNNTKLGTNIATYFSTVSSTEFNNFLKLHKPVLLEKGDYFYNKYQTTSDAYAPGIKIFDEESIKNFETTEAFDDKSINKFLTLDFEENFSNIKKETPDIDLFLCKEDIPFTKKYLTEYPHLKAFNKFALNYKSDTVWKYFCKYFNFQDTEYDYSRFVNKQEDTNGTISIKETVVYLLKHCWLLLRCSFFADYVDYRDFNQDLSQSAKVVHNNLILSSKGDYNRYDSIADDIPDDARTTRPYIPTITPSIDSQARDYFNRNNIDKDADLLVKMTALIKDGANPDSKIGALQTETFEEIKEDKSDRFTSTESNTPVPLWFDPESRKEASEYGEVPILFEKDGNLIMDGRIISRTIDELWEMIKKLVGGRKSTIEAQSDSDVGYPYGTGELETNFDTRPSIKSHKFVNNGKTSIGDPTYISYNEGDFLSFSVDEWINNPNKIHYSLMSELVSLSKKDYNEDTLNTVSAILEKLENKPREYDPAEQPLSLRELEGLLKGIKYNMAILINYQNQNFVRVGQRGITLDREIWNKAAGGLYQLHKDYENIKDKDLTYNGYNLGKITADMIPHNNQDKVPSYAIYLGADGEYHSVSQAINIRIRDDEEF
ncbi:MAG: hypothetical protein HUJ68_09530 [Clostridia bacterium]|nr:hypothetical protein [Clostridia bacterium]